MFNMVSMLILNLFPFFRSIILKHFFKVSWFASQVFLKFLWLGATKKLKKNKIPPTSIYHMHICTKVQDSNLN
jgi:hypothetical protein